MGEGAVGGWEGGEGVEGGDEGLDTVTCGRLEVFFEVGTVASRKASELGWW